MKVLLDHDLPKQLRLKLKGHLALTARQMGWEALSNGRLIAAAEAEGFDVLLTADTNMFGQQNHLTRRLSPVVVTNGLMLQLEPQIDAILAAMERATAGSFEEVAIPQPGKTRKRRGNV